VNRKSPRDEIGFGRQDVAILANPRDFARVLHFAQGFAQLDALIGLKPEGAPHLYLVERAVILPAEEPKETRAKSGLILLHFQKDTI
jgi:hypothetical protein